MKGLPLGAFYPYAMVYCYLEYKLRYLKNLKLFSIWVKELFEPIVLRKKMNINDRYLLFLKAFSWETDLWVTVGDFTTKQTRKIGKENLYLTENQVGRNEILCVEDSHSYMCHMCAKEYLKSNFN